MRNLLKKLQMPTSSKGIFYIYKGEQKQKYQNFKQL
jgi:hypothetical protein